MTEYDEEYVEYIRCEDRFNVILTIIVLIGLFGPFLWLLIIGL